jgi:nucleotide-binding universal stress UspA family protein
MAFRDVLVVLRPYPARTPDSAVDYAVAIAGALGARASAIACAVTPKVPRNILGNAVLDVSAMVAGERKKSTTDAQGLLKKFEEAVAKHQGVLGEQIFKTCQSFEAAEILAGQSRLHDLTILPMPEGDYVSQFDVQWYAEAIIFGSGHPTIVLPQERKGGGPVALQRVIAAWDKSRSSARAISDAMPILQKAKQVRLLTVTGEKSIGSEQSGAEFARHLALHGVDVVVDEVSAGRRTIGEVFHEQAMVHEIDLIVMGAYGRSRLREFILGGATKSMLTHPPTGLFLSH